MKVLIVAVDDIEMLFRMKLFSNDELFLLSRLIDYGRNFCAWVLNN